MRTHALKRVANALIGAVLGFVVGAIIAVNIVITAGVDQGYQASLPEIFEESIVLGTVTVAILASGPVLGVIVAHHLQNREEP